MKIGTLRNAVEVQKVEEVQDELGQPVEIWKTLHTVWASISPITGREILDAGAERSDITARIVIRWFDGLNTKHRIKFGERIFDIKVVIDDKERTRQYNLMCKEHTSGD